MTSSGPGRPALYLAGPTASGKSAVALELARRLGGEILSVDSMQVYRGLDIGTAKPGPAELRMVPHHLIDLVEPSHAFDTAQWLEAAHSAERAVRARGMLPLFCGGTGLYFKALLEGLDPVPSTNPAVRAVLESTPMAELLAELERGDPETFARVDRRNPRRVVRAVEILRLSGPRRTGVQPESGIASPGGVANSGQPVVVLRREPEDLRRRIDARVDAMMASGLVDETRGLLTKGLGENRTAMQAIGYRQVLEHLRGERDLGSTVSVIKSRTWQFARRQLTWFRHQPRVFWVEVAVDEPSGATADRILAGLGFSRV